MRVIAWLIRWNDKAGHNPQPLGRHTSSIHGKFSLGSVKPGKDRCRLVHICPIKYAPGFGWQLDLDSVHLSSL